MYREKLEQVKGYLTESEFKEFLTDEKQKIEEEIKSNLALMEDKNTGNSRFVRLSERNMELMKMNRELWVYDGL